MPKGKKEKKCTGHPKTANLCLMWLIASWIAKDLKMLKPYLHSQSDKNMNRRA